ncbi:MAG: DUF3830 family protein [Bacteroidetes bacterium]|nr:DUF3830 family protein [Bacteroidota bacterium]
MENSKAFVLRVAGFPDVHFDFYLNDAPATCAAFRNLLPFARTLVHARVSGEEIWFDDLPEIEVIQENASVFTLPGEVVLGPSNAHRTKTAGCFGIYYGAGKGLDACNIFAMVRESDRDQLCKIGERIWKQGAAEAQFLPSAE